MIKRHGRFMPFFALVHMKLTTSGLAVPASCKTSTCDSERKAASGSSAKPHLQSENASASAKCTTVCGKQQPEMNFQREHLVAKPRSSIISKYILGS